MDGRSLAAGESVCAAGCGGGRRIHCFARCAYALCREKEGKANRGSVQVVVRPRREKECFVNRRALLIFLAALTASQLSRAKAFSPLEEWDGVTAGSGYA